MSKKMRSIYLFWLLLTIVVLPKALEAQLHGNEWINFNQQYVKIPVAQDGIYKITYQDLQNAGFPVGSINPRNLQLFHRGKEQAIQVEGENNNIFDPQDYVLFYGQRNDGALDEELYVTPDAQPHKYYNLYSDTTSYFLTFNLINQAGKRMELFSENNTTNLNPEPFFMEERLIVNSENYSGGRVYQYGGEFHTSIVYGDYGEGFTGTVVSNGQVRDITFSNLTNQATNGPAPQLEVLLAGRNNIAREIELLAGNSTTALQLVHTAAFTGAIHYKIAEPLTWSQLAGGQFISRVATAQGERVSISYAKLSYAKNWDMEGAYEKVFRLPAGENSRRFIRVKNVPSNVVAYDITQPENVVRIGFKREDGSTVSAMLFNGTSDRKILFSGVIMPVPGVKKVNFRKINPSQVNYIIVTHPVLRKPAGEYTDPVKAYAGYRASVSGGGFDTLLINIGQLYDQFSYGEITPMAIRRLATYVAAQGSPEYLFLVGKALDVYYNYYRSTSWTNTNHNLVPTFGFPGGDVPFTAHINGSGLAPAFPVGRLGARAPQDVVNYLNKVKEMEGAPVIDLSRKNLVHLSGGSNKSQALQFKYYLDEYKQIAEGAYLGGKVETVSKTSDLVVQEIDITKQVNQGVGLVTFFGHSGSNVSDMEIGYVSDDRSGYRNKGKYPCVLVNGCDAGAIFSTNQNLTFGEDWIFTADKGALNFIAHSSVGYTNLLRSYSSGFYHTAFADTVFIGASVGKIQAEAIRRFVEVYGQNQISMAQAQEMVLQGDPAVKLFGRERPDFEVNNEGLSLQSYTNNPVSLAADSFAVAIVTRNFGRVHQDSMVVKLNILASSSTQSLTLEEKFPSPFYQDTLFFKVRSKELAGPALYRFEVQLNPGGVILELNNTNNSATLETSLSSGGTLNLLPHDYAILSKSEGDLFLQSSNFFANREYLLEIDTSADFSSGSLQRHTINGDVVVKARVSLPETLQPNIDSLVYFWRSRIQQPEATEDPSWTQSSFTYIKGNKPGWSQSHPEQFRENELDGVDVDAAKKWSFHEIVRQIKVITFGATAASMEGNAVEIKIDELGYILGQGRECTTNSINAVHFSKEGIEPLLAVREGPWRRESCGRLPQIINNFIEKEIIYGNNSEYNLEKFLSEIPENDFVVLFSLGNVNYEQWPPSVKVQLVSLGADPAKIATLTNGEPYILIGQKGSAAGTAKEAYAVKDGGDVPPAEQGVELAYTMEGKRSIGGVTSRLIGPAKEWQETAFSITPGPDDVYELQVIGVNQQMEEEVLIRSASSNKIPLEVDAALFPYLKLKMVIKDEVNQTPPQLRNWQVTFEPLPEGVLLPTADLQKQYILDEGQDFEAGFRFVNISEYAYADSLIVDYTTFNATSGRSRSSQIKIVPPAPADTTHFSYHTNTDGQGGKNDLRVQVNPVAGTENYFQNNILGFRELFMVRRDTIQPVVDVAFDGVYISNGAIVSPKPLITVVMRDDNKIKFKQDTTGVHLYMKKECEDCVFERINLASSKVRWKPANEEEDFRIEFEPESFSDGIYTLQVQGEDASENKAGAKPYSISFEVITESSVTNFYPYPNPFSTSTRFVFTLTGSQVPDDIKIQIMTVDGRVVREILKEELGPIRIGHNISEFAWDGRDEWGDQLANGVYLYKVYLRHSGDVFEHRETKGDKSFKQGFGKMYLLR